MKRVLHEPSPQLHVANPTLHLVSRTMHELNAPLHLRNCRPQFCSRDIHRLKGWLTSRLAGLQRQPGLVPGLSGVENVREA